jgi:chemotaxis protein MotB
MGLMALAGYMASCVPARKFQDTENALKEKQDSLRIVLSNYRDCREDMAYLDKQFSQIKDEVEALKSDTARLGREYNRLQKMNENLNTLYEKVIEQNRELLRNSNLEREKLAVELNEKEKMLNEKSLELERKAELLSEKEAELEKKNKSIAALREGLEAREKKVKQLERMIAEKDSAVNNLRKKMEEALTGFNESELSVLKKNGKVYVSMSDKLLFKSGSWELGENGKSALKQIADVMNKNPEIEILIEGHTDSIPVRPGGCVKDNWDLSVLRATSVVRILEDYGVDPKRLLPAGRAAYYPVAANSSAEGRSKNRRTEIILSPRLNKIMNLLEGKDK